MFLRNLSLETTNCQQQGERATLKTGVTRKQSITNFSINEHFLLIDQGVRNVRFSKNLACFASL